MIQFNKVTKRYDNGVIAIDNMTLRIDQGEFVYLTGPSGSGKSTFMKLIYRDEIASYGEIIVGPYNLQTMSKKQVPYLRRYLGVIFQDFKLLERLTVGENISYALEITGESRKRINRRVDEVLDQVKLSHKIKQYPEELSGGEQQRVAIARALANRPHILIADEPTGNLDPVNAREILRILEEINLAGTTILMGTHASQLVDQFPHRLLRLDQGRLVLDSEKGGYHEGDA